MPLQDLKTELAQAASPASLLEKAWHSSLMNATARGYIAGMIDALRYANAISLEEYNSFYTIYVYRK